MGGKGTRLAKITLTKNRVWGISLPDFKTSYIATVVNAVAIDEGLDTQINATE